MDKIFKNCKERIANPLFFANMDKAVVLIGFDVIKLT
jgi:hypothetical protein